MTRWLVVLVAALVPMLPGAAEPTKPAEENARATAAMSQDVYEKLQQAQVQVESQAYSSALATLGSLASQEGLSNYERAQVDNLSAYVHYLKEDYAAAIVAYERMLTLERLPRALLLGTLKTLAQLYFIVERYSEAITSTQRLMAESEQPEPDLYLLLGQAYYQLKQYHSALPPIENAIRLYRERGMEPEENWLLLLYAIHYEMDDYDALLTLLRELVHLYPRDQHLVSLAGVYGELQDTTRQLALTEALYESGILDASSHAINLANLYLLHGLPYKAAVVLQEALGSGSLNADINTLRLLAQAWQRAQEHDRALAPLAQAAALGKDGSLYVLLAQSYTRMQQWAEASRALEQALDKGGLKNHRDTELMLGITLFHQQRFKDARTAFEAAAKSEHNRKSARQWLAYINRELEIRRAISLQP